MPLVNNPSDAAFKANLKAELAAGKPKDQALAIAYDVQRRAKRASGGRAEVPYFAKAKARAFAGGGLASPVPGRTDKLPLDVPAGSYVLPSDVVSGLGEGNTAAGVKTLDLMFKRGPYGTKAPSLGRARAVKPKGLAAPRMLSAGAAKSGKRRFADGGAVPIIAAGGEYLVPPDQVAAIGGGDIDQGHAVLDAFVNQVRADTIGTLSSLPGPAQ